MNKETKIYLGIGIVFMIASIGSLIWAEKKSTETMIKDIDESRERMIKEANELYNECSKEVDCVMKGEKMEFKGYDIKSGYLGTIDGEKIEFPTEEEYNEMVKEKEDKNE